MPLRDSLFVPFRAVCAPGQHECACVAGRGFCHVLPLAFSSRAGCRRPVSVRACCGVRGMFRGRSGRFGQSAVVLQPVCVDEKQVF